ncbi:MAG: DUF3365 domain-containing protein [Planctomycetaceae bacterium]
MKVTTFIKPGVLGIAGLLCLMFVLAGDQSAGQENSPTKKKSRPEPEIAAEDRVSVEVARDRAKLMHDIYEATLDTMHDHYFHGEKAAVPARAMEDVFYSMKRKSKAEARWIAVNSRAMSLDHEPETEFEKIAAQQITAGKNEYEEIKDGYYRRAGAIPLHGGCIRCHNNIFGEPPKTAKFAGLVISVPIHLDPAASETSDAPKAE